MDFHELLLQRHSIRRYTDQPLDPEHVKTILEAGLLAPSSKSARSWQFVVVEDHDTMLRLMECKPAYAASRKMRSWPSDTPPRPASLSIRQNCFGRRFISAHGVTKLNSFYGRLEN